MIPSQLLDELRQIVGPEHVSCGDVDAEVYSYDGSLAFGTPDAVVFPADTAQTAGVMRATADAGAPCTPRGFGTNLSGGSVARQGGVVLCFTRMNRILCVDPARRCAVVQPGVTNFELQEALAPLGCYYAPDPASQKVSTFGGNVAENAGGPHCVKYGVTTNHILGMEAVLPGGEVVRVAGPALDPPGYDLRGLLVGSEGTLAAVTEVTVRILPKPESVITMLAVYDTARDAATSVSGIIAKGIVPATLEMMDGPVIRAVEERLSCGYPHDAAAVLIIEVEGLAAGLRQGADSIREICQANGCRSIEEALDAADRDRLWSGRRGAFGALARIAPNFYSADCTVPRSRLPEALERVAEIAAARGFPYANVLHAGDGNLHPVLFFDVRDEGQLRLVHEAGHEIMQACVGLGGTLTGEHGVGVEKMEAMTLVFPEDSLEFQRTVRRAADPTGLFNPGKLFPEPKAAPAAAEPAATEIAGALEPVDAAEACGMVRASIARAKPLLPVGHGRRADFGNASEQPLTPISSRRLAAVVDLDPDNQVVVAEAGVRLVDVQQRLAGRGQWVPVRPPLADGCTLGGMAALNLAGPERLAYGATRDRILGLRFVSGLGRQIGAGGQVVKNVAGYDVPRLLVGSAGTLGFLTEVTLYVATMPHVCRAIAGRGSLAQCAAAAAELLRGSLGPASVSAAPTGDDPTAWELQAWFEGFDVTVRRQTERGADALRSAGLHPCDPREYAVQDGLYAGAFGELFQSDIVLRVDLPLDAPAGFVSDAGDLLDAAAMLVDFGCGRVSAGLSSLPDDSWPGLCARAARAGGHAVLEKAPADFKQRHDVFGSARLEWLFMHRLKHALDPHDVFAPGRLPGRDCAASRGAVG